MKHSFALCSATLLIAALASPHLTAQFGRRLCSIDLDAATGGNGSLGCAHLNATGETFVTARGSAGSTTPPHTVYVFNQAGALLRSFPQSATANNSAWGWRDGATDGVGTMLFGSEAGIEAIASQGGPANTILAANGPQPIAALIPVGALTTTARALAYDPNGNGGNGSIYLANFGSDIWELDLNGFVLNSFPFNGQWSIYGLALDPLTGTLWCNDNGSREIFEFDPTTGLPTGVTIPRAGTGIIGGLGIAPGGPPRNSGFDLIAVEQDTPDRLDCYRLHYAAIPGQLDPCLLTGLDDLPLTPPPCTIINGTNTQFTWQVTYGTSDLPTVLFVNLMAVPPNPNEGMLNPFLRPTYRCLADEFHRVTDFTTPPTVCSPYVRFFPLPGVTNAVQSFSTSALLAIPPQKLLAQAVVVDFAAPPICNALLATKENGWDWRNAPLPDSLVCLASGPNSFNSNTGSGFWSFQNTNPGGLSVTSLVLDWNGSGQPTMVWDPDQTGMADRFDGGNSVVPGCQGTYRNGSDALTGLVYAGTPVAPCDATAMSGFTITPDFKTLTFNFTSFGPGDVFEFDADTDGGSGVQGGNMAGLVITATFSDGSVRVGSLANVSTLVSQTTL